MSNIGNLYFELQEQAEYYGMDLDFETLEFIPKKELPPVPSWLAKWKNREEDFDTNFDIDRSDDEQR